MNAIAAYAYSPEVVQSYISEYKSIALNNEKEYGIPAPIILAQGILESALAQAALFVLRITILASRPVQSGEDRCIRHGMMNRKKAVSDAMILLPNRIRIMQGF